MYWCWICICILFIRVSGDASSSLQSLFNQYYQWRLIDDPELATNLNVHTNDDKVSGVGPKEFDKIKVKVNGFLTSLSGVDFSSLPRQQQYNYIVFNNTLRTMSENYKWITYGPMNPVSFLEGIHIDPGYVLDITPFKTKQDFENFLSRMHGISGQIHAIIGMMTDAYQTGKAHNRVSMIKVPGQIDQLLKNKSTDFVLYKPFTADLDKLSISDAEKASLRSKAQTASSNLMNGYRTLKRFIKTQYTPRTRGTYGVGGLPQGAAYYRSCLRWHTTTDISPGDVHQVGLREVDRISRTMKQIMLRQNFTGTISEYFAMLRKDQRFHFRTADDIITKYKDILYNKLYPSLPKVFKNIPKLKVKVSKMSFDGPPAQYQLGSSDGTRAGEFQANVFRPSETDSFVMTAYALHEGVPGHHLQFSVKETSNLPEFRKEDTAGAFYSVPFSYPGYSSYTEGWALYAEYLGEELGVYTDDYELMGRYSNEIFRATRLVVDTGIHFMGWTKRMALNFMQRYNSLSGGNLENEVDRYITWPGQACAYKIGELKIRELRRKATAALGAKFDIKDFHSVILNAGAVPLGLLETIINDWIADTLSRHSSHNSRLPLSGTTSGHVMTGHVTSTKQAFTKSTQRPGTKITVQIPVLPNIG